jgi:hypothetical protein
MATQNRLRDTATDFNTVYENTANRFGIQNARVENQQRSLTLRPSEDASSKKNRIRYQGPAEIIDFDEERTKRDQKVEQRYQINQQEKLEAANTNSALLPKQNIKTSLFARARGISFGIVTISWLIPIYLLWQLPISVVGSIMLGLAMQVEASYLLSAIDTAAQTFGSLFGYDYFDFAGAGILATITVAGIGVVCACAAGISALLLELHPLSGNAAGTKTLTFLVGVVGSCIPFVNMFPWIIFWVLVMMRYPK